MIRIRPFVRGLLLGAACLAAAGSIQAAKIELWTFVGPGTANVRERAMTQVLESFKAKNPGIEVNVTVLPWQQLSPTLLRAAKAGQVPDVAMLYSPSMPGQIAAGTLLPLKRYLDAWPAAERADLVRLPETVDRQGNPFGVPWELRVSGLGYRADLLKAANKQPPRSIKEWGEIANEVSTNDIAGIAIGFSPEAPSVAAGWFLTTLVGSGVKVLTDDGKAAFNTPQSERLVQWVLDLSTKGKKTALPLNVAMQGLEQSQTLFIAQKAVFLPQSSQRFEFIRERSKLDANLKLLAYPGWEEGKPSPALVQSWSLVIPKGAKNPDAAWKFIEHWSSTPIQVESAKMAGYVPVRSSALKDPWFNDPKAETIRWAVDYAARNPLQFNFPENTEALYDTWAKMFGNVLTGRMTPKEALAWAEQEYDRRAGR
jgi:ABC-type glycerol-3-phosphate transport system substrate-binding protein